MADQSDASASWGIRVETLRHSGVARSLRQLLLADRRFLICRGRKKSAPKR